MQGFDPNANKATQGRLRYVEEKEEDIEQIDLSEPTDMPNVKLTKAQNISDSISHYFSEAYLQVERIIGPAIIFPALQPQEALKVKGRWEE